MKRAMKWIVSAMALSVSVAHAEIAFPIQTQVDRFTPRLDAMDQRSVEISKLGSIEQQIEALDNSGVRELMTELQSLFRLYQGGKRYKALAPYYEKTKRLEDYISHVRDYKSFASEARMNADPATAAKYQELLDRETARYTQFIHESGWFDSDLSLSKKMREDLASVHWPNLNRDRDFLLTRIAKRLGKVQKKQYDVSKMELGVHELKRDLRRLSYFNNAVGNLIYPDYNRACPIGQDVQKQERTSVEEYTCRVSSCLMQKLSEATSSLDSLKMQGIRQELAGQSVPSSVVQQAQAILDDVKNSKVLLHLEKQIKGCRSPGADKDPEIINDKDPEDGGDAKDKGAP